MAGSSAALLDLSVSQRMGGMVAPVSDESKAGKVLAGVSGDPMLETAPARWRGVQAAVIVCAFVIVSGAMTTTIRAQQPGGGGIAQPVASTRRPIVAFANPPF